MKANLPLLLSFFLLFGNPLFSQSTLPPEMVSVTGTGFNGFQMGCTFGQSNLSLCDVVDETLHAVKLPSFFIAKYELTQGQWLQLIAPQDFMPGWNPGNGSGPLFPCADLSFYEAATFCNRLSKSQGLTPCYYSDPEMTLVFDNWFGTNNNNTPTFMDIYWHKGANGYRMPTEAEWEYAARGGIFSQDKLYAGNDNINPVAVYNPIHPNDNPVKSQPVGSKAPNELGLFDMSGNLWERCWDFYGQDYYSTGDPCSPFGSTTGDASQNRVFRGGNWNLPPVNARMADRSFYWPGYRGYNFGVRLARWTVMNTKATDTLDCGTNSLVLQASSSIPNATFLWKNAAGQTLSGQNPTVTATGRYTLTVNDPATGCVFTSSTWVVACQNSACDVAADRSNLVKIYNSTNGSGWNFQNNWLSAQPINQWYGIVTNANGCVEEILLADNKLTGTLPTGLSFPELKNLNFGGGGVNQIAGTVPTDWDLPQVEFLNFSSNKLTGNIPNLNFPNLKEIFFSNNQFSGSVPNQTQLPNLEKYHFHTNPLAGTIPVFTNLPKLKELSAFNCNFSGFATQTNFINSGQPFDLLQLEGNQFTFEDLLPNLAGINFTGTAGNRSYSPQDSVFLETTFTKNVGDALTIDLVFDAAAAAPGTVFSWFKNGQPWTPPAPNVSSSNKLIFNNLQLTDAGEYHVQVTNPGVSPLTLLGRKITIFIQNNSSSGKDCWEKIAKPTNLELQSNWFFDENTGIAVGGDGTNSGIILRTTNAGLNWTPVLTTSIGSLESVVFPTSQIGWAVGTNNLIAKTIDGGLTWTAAPISSTPPVGASISLNDVFFKNVNEGFIVAANDRLFKTVNGGNSWTLSQGVLSDLIAITFPTASIGYIGGSNGRMLKTTDGGANWNAAVTDAGSSADLVRIDEIFFLDNSVGWVVGNNAQDPARGYIKKTMDGGVSWEEQGCQICTPNFPFPFPGISNVYFTDSLNGWATGAGASFFQTNNSGATWNYKQGGGSLWLNRMFFVGTTAYAGGKEGEIFKLIDCPTTKCPDDSTALVAFYNATGGDSWTKKDNWKTAQPLSLWHGIKLNVNGCVEEILLADNKLTGTLPTGLSFAELKNLNIGGNGLNQITGNFPTGWNLPLVEFLNFSSNKFTGNIPDLAFPNLKEVFFSNNSFNGSVANPTQLPNLEKYHFHTNPLAGTIPVFTNFPKLKELSAFNCNFSGFATQTNFINSGQPFDLLELEGNQFTFEDLLPNLAGINFTGAAGNRSYNPQDSVFSTTILSKNAGDALTIDLGFDAAVPNNKYAWFKNGLAWTPPVPNVSNSNKLIFNSLKLADAGMYQVQVTNPGASALTLFGRKITINVTCAAPPNISATGGTLPCGGASINLNGGSTAPGAMFSWTGPGSFSSILDDPLVNVPGTYFLTVTDQNGCTASASATVVVSTPPGATIAPAGATTFCSPGSVDLTANTGSGLSYQWKKDGIDISGATSAIFSATESGSFTVVVTNQNNCSATSMPISVQVNTSPPVTISASSATVFCSPGSVSLTANTGSGLFYQWKKDGNDISGATSAVFSATESGGFSVVVTNQSGCSDTALVTIIELPAPMVTAIAQPASCNQSNGSVILTVGNSSNPMFLWSNGKTMKDLTDVGTGVFSVTVTSQNGCTTTATATVTSADAAMLVATSTQSRCDQPTGAINLNVSDTTGTPTFLWNNGLTTQNLQNLSAGNYTVTVKNGNGCTSVATATVANFPPPTATALGGTVDCSGASVVLQGSSGSAGAQFSWSGPGGFSSILQNPSVSTAGQYLLKVTDPASGCTATAAATVILNGNAPTAAVLKNTPPTCFGLADGSIEVGVVTGGTAPYLYALGNGAFSANLKFGGLAAGSFTIKVQDANGCEFSKTINLSQPAAILINLGSKMTQDFGVEFSLTAPPNFAKYLWSNGSTTAEIKLAPPPGTYFYMVTVTDANGCTATDEVEVEILEKGLPPNTDPDVFTPNGDDKNEFYIVQELVDSPDGYPDNEFLVYNRWGDQVFYKKPYDNKWDGKNQNGSPLPEGTYYYLILLDKSRGEKLRHGAVLILR